MQEGAKNEESDSAWWAPWHNACGPQWPSFVSIDQSAEAMCRHLRNTNHATQEWSRIIYEHALASQFWWRIKTWSAMACNWWLPHIHELAHGIKERMLRISKHLHGMPCWRRQSQSGNVSSTFFVHQGSGFASQLSDLTVFFSPGRLLQLLVAVLVLCTSDGVCNMLYCS